MPAISRKLASLLILPALLLAGWFAYEQLPAALSPVPAWLRPANPDAVAGACEARASLEARGGTFARAPAGASVTMDDARQIALAAVTDAYGLAREVLTLENDPAPVRARFDDAGERLAWLALVRLVDDSDARPGAVALAYVDANSGELLALATAPTATDPAATCGSAPIGRRALLRQYLPLVLLGVYAGALVLAGLLRRLWARRTPSRTVE